MNKRIYRVGIWEESGGYVDIEAESMDKAEEDVGKLLLEHGLDVLMRKGGGEIHRAHFEGYTRIKYAKHTHGSSEVISVENINQ